MACSVAVLLVATGCWVTRCYSFYRYDTDSANISASPAIYGNLIVEPTEIVLHGTNRQQQLMVTLVSDDAESLDVTRQCEISVADRSLARVSGSTLLAVSNGSTHAVVSIGGLEVNVPLRVEQCELYPPIHFASDIVPVLSKLGCNGGGCHGRVQGQNGFKLSVFGYDPQSDYNAIVKESRGRRIQLSSPKNSLLVQKATASVAHGGGRRLKEDSAEFELLRRWIEQGLPLGSDDAPRLVGLNVSPAERILKAGGEQQILATAVFSDGTQRDVTHASNYASNAMSVAEVASNGQVRCGELSGDAAITINYMGQVAVVQIHRPRVPFGLEQANPSLPINNRVDELVGAKLAKMGLSPSELASDEMFLRRLYLDVIGTLPTSAEVREFLADADSNKRAQWIGRVLDRPEYADYWALKWADILLVDKEKLGDRGAFEFHRWLREQFECNRPYDKWVREILTATGNSGRNGPVNLYRAADNPEALARTISQAFLGVRIECAQCHHHPFDRWSQADFYGLAGFFQGLERKPLALDRTLLVHSGYQPMVIPISNTPVVTRPLGLETAPDLTKTDPRVILADWLTSKNNQWFARSFANRLWKQLLGRGLVEPEDDMRLTNPSTNEPLLAFLAQQAIDAEFDQKAVIRLILNSRVYQTSSVPNDHNQDDDQNFSHYYVKRLPAEVLLDAISSATGVAEAFPGQPRGTRSLQLWDNRLPSYFLEIFGRPPRNSPCECGRTSEPTMAQALHLINAPEVESKIGDNGGRIAKWLTSCPNDLSQRLKPETEMKLVDEICLVTIGRLPGPKEQNVAQELFAKSNPRQAAEDFMWAMLNSYDFLFIQ